MGIYTTIFQKNQYNLAQVAQKSRSWFTQQATLLSKQKIEPNRLIRSEPSKNVMRIVPGELYMFQYDPKLKDTLPYWDMFPLVFPFRRLKDGFIGLNMHYLPYNLRVRVLDALVEHANNQNMDETTRIKFSWSIIQGASRLKIAEPCVHRYLIQHVKSPFKRVVASDWATAMMLPVERFVGSSKQQVWTDSLK